MIEGRRTLLVDAFTDRPLAGNAAGVVPNATDLSTDQMQAVARELSVSETAFIRESGDAERSIRYFTPTQEVELCGHATIGSHAALHADGVIDTGTHTLETAIGVIEIDISEDAVVWMTQDTPQVDEVDIDIEELAATLDVPPAGISGVDLPVAVASTGLPFLIVPITFLELLGDATPDMDAIETLADRFDAIGVYAFTFDTIGPDATLHGRCFVPGAGVPEDPVTGTASGATGGYLRTVDAFESLPEEMLFEQGHFLDRPGQVHVQARDEIRVGGTAVTTLEGTLTIPTRNSDEILDA